MGLLGLAGSLLGMIPKVGSPGGKKKGKSGGSKGKSAKKSSQKKSSTKKKQRKSNKKKKKKKRKKKKKKWGKFFTKARKLKNSLSKSKLVKRAKKAIKKAVLTTKKVVKKTKAAVTKAKQQVKTAVKQTKQVVKEKVLPVVKKAAQATTKAVKNAVKPKNLLNTLQTGLDIVGMVPVVGEVADGVNGIIYAARGDKVNAALSFGAMIPVVGNAATAGKWVNKGGKLAKDIVESAQKTNKGLLGRVKEKVNKQVANAKTQIQSKVDEVKQQLRQLGAPQMELAGVNVGRISDTGTVGRNTTTPSPKPSNSQPPQNGSNKKPAENKGTGKDVTFKKGYDTHLIEVEGFKAKPNIGIKGGHNLENFEKFILDNFGNQVKDINQAVTKKSHPDISGIYEVKYKLPVYDGLSTANGGKGNFTGQWKEYKNPKTVYDPKVFPDEQILKLGRDAMEEGISNNRITHGGGRSPSDLVEGYVDVNGKQLKFMGFKDKNTGEISNFFPVLD